MDNSNVHSTTTVAPATTFAILVTLNTEEWPAIVETTAKGTWTAHDCEKCMECTMSINRQADGGTLVSYGSFEDETPLSSLAIMATPETTTDAINEVCDHLLANTRGFWSGLVASFREKDAAIPPMKVTTNRLRTIEPDDWPCVVEFSHDGVKERRLIWLKRRRRPRTELH